MDLEKKIGDYNQTLIRATTLGDGKSIASLSITIHNMRKEIDQLFEELDRFTKEHIARSNDLEKKWGEITSTIQ